VCCPTETVLDGKDELATRTGPPTTLSARLEELARAGVLERRVINSRPPRTEYALTEKGRRLSALVDALVVFETSR